MRFENGPINIGIAERQSMLRTTLALSPRQSRLVSAH